MEHKNIEVRGARVHNLKSVDVNIPLGQIVGIAGGKIIAVGTPEDVSNNQDSVTGRFIRHILA